MSARKKRIAAQQSLYDTQQGRIEKPDVYGSRKRRILAAQRAQKKDSDDEDDDDEFGQDLSMDSDAINAAEYLIKNNTKSCLPVCFVHQVYSILPNNNTATDRDLQHAFQQGTWRKFHIIGALEDEHVLLKTENYLDMINKAKSKCSQSEGETESKVFDVFREVVVGAKYQVLVTQKVLTDKFNLSDHAIAKLVSYGLLIPHHIQVGAFWFSIPNQGAFMTNLSNGRLEVLRILKKRATKDIMEKLLRQKKLNKSSFDFDFLMHDLIGSGRVERYPTAMGDLIRLTSKGEKGI